MPNIIEQQDLLKGLPDNRLAMMMQNPTGDIPPFLVAAEAQRRQAIRQQFSGGPQESVVETLTKQMANVPQNIQAPAQQPPRLPPPQMQPQMAGVAALQQQMPQQAMRRGGIVQRYQTGSLVKPSFYSTEGSPSEQMARTYMMLNPGISYEEALQRASIGQPLAAPTVGDVAAAQAARVGEGMSGVGNYSVLRGSQTAPAPPLIAEQVSGVSPANTLGVISTYDPLSSIRKSKPGVPTASPIAEPRDPNAGKDNTSLENQMTAEDYEAELRAISSIGADDSEYARQKIQELYGDNEASDWEKAQKWFSAAQAAIEPGQNNWQATINALSAFGGGMAEERAAEREGQQEMAEALFKFELADRQARTQDERDIAEGMLKYRIAEIEAKSEAAAARKQQQIDAFKFSSDVSGVGIRAANDQIERLERAKADYIKTLPEQLPGSEPIDYNKDPYIAGINSQISRIQTEIDAAQGRVLNAIKGYGEATGTNLSIPVWRDGRLQ